jgi:hypothetical protein
MSWIDETKLSLRLLELKTEVECTYVTPNEAQIDVILQ